MEKAFRFMRRADSPKPFTVWFTGLPASGKTTLGSRLSRRLTAMGRPAAHLDGDALRQTISRGLGFSKSDRIRQAARVARQAVRLNRAGTVVVVSLVSPYRKSRMAARKKIGAFVEIYLDCPLRVCQKRDSKGLYRLAHLGKIRRFTGISDPYEKPIRPELTLKTHRSAPASCVRKVIATLQKMKWL